MVIKYGGTIYVDETLPPLARLETLIHEIAEAMIMHVDGDFAMEHTQFTRMFVLLVPALLDLGLLNMPEDDDE